MIPGRPETRSSLMFKRFYCFLVWFCMPRYMQIHLAAKVPPHSQQWRLPSLFVILQSFGAIGEAKHKTWFFGIAPKRQKSKDKSTIERICLDFAQKTTISIVAKSCRSTSWSLQLHPFSGFIRPCETAHYPKKLSCSMFFQYHSRRPFLACFNTDVASTVSCCAIFYFENFLKNTRWISFSVQRATKIAVPRTPGDVLGPSLTRPAT